MRPITNKGIGQFGPDFLQRPLNEVFGSEVKIRILRFLITKDDCFLASEIARQIEVSSTGTRKTLKQLETTGFVEPIGGGKRRLWQIRQAEPLIKPLKKFFKEEKK